MIIYQAATASEDLLQAWGQSSEQMDPLFAHLEPTVEMNSLESNYNRVGKNRAPWEHPAKETRLACGNQGNPTEVISKLIGRLSLLHQQVPRAEVGLNCCPADGHWSSAFHGAVGGTHPDCGQGCDASTRPRAQILSVHVSRIHKVPTLSHLRGHVKGTAN